ncbi:MAG: hypothetical protein IJ025_00325 [Clostridia bacterium]|nr:hypothetical protein [Clostridia bacterium]
MDMFYYFSDILNEAVPFLKDIESALGSLLGIAEIGVAGVVLIAGIIGSIFSFIVSVIFFILEAIPVYLIAKKHGRKSALLAFVPFFSTYFKLYVLSDIAGDKPLKLLGDKLEIKNRKLSVWVYIGIDLFGETLIYMVVALLSVVITGIGAVSSVLLLVPAAAKVIMEYAILRDVIDIYKPNKSGNKKVAIVISVLDSLVTLGFVRIVYLYTLIKLEPLCENQVYDVKYTDVVPEAQVNTAPVGAAVPTQEPVQQTSQTRM